MNLSPLLQLLLLLRWLHWTACRADDGDSAEKRQVLVKEVVLDSAVVDILYLGKDHECVLVTTKSKRLYFSEDSGMSWNEITGKVEKSGNFELQVDRIIISPTDKTVAVLQVNRRARSSDSGASGTGTSGGKWWPYVYVSEDSGRNWRKAWGKQHGLHSWIAHPTERSWALVSWWSGDCSAEKAKSSPKGDSADEEQEEDRKPCVHRLMLTKDLGRNFFQLAEYVVQFSWGSTAAGQTYRVYFTAYRTKTGDQGRLSLWTTEVDFHYIDIPKKGRSSGKSVECLRYGNKFLVSNEFVLVAKVRDEVQQTVHLMVSRDGGKSFKAALLPSGMGELEEKWYTVLDTSEGTVILHINSNAEGVKDTGRVFVSDGEGYKYSQSLVNNVRSAHGECEFDRVISLQGVYLANVVVPEDQVDQSYRKARERAEEDVEKEAASGAEVDQKHGRGFSKGKTSKASKEERPIRTVISFDKGAAWKYLKPPKVNSQGKPFECSGRPPEACSLHLHGTTSWDMFAPFYSSESSVGIIMGTGNVGPVLRFEPEETSTFLSRDGGLTWMEAHKGAFIYEFGDHGGLIVMADDLKKTTQVLFTWNEGQNWMDFTVSKTPFDVDNIITEPNLTSTTFLMFGTREEGVGVIYYLRFDALQFKSCTGVWAAGSVSSDYESWTPWDGVGSEKCLLGQQVTYTRRKQTSQCWNGERFERPVVQKRCTCTKANYACDIGFVRGVNQVDCVYGGPDMMPERFIPPVCAKTFPASAYRKVAGDRCESGFRPEPVEVPCPISFFRSGYTRWGLVCSFLLAAGCVLQSRRGGGGKGEFNGLGDFKAEKLAQLRLGALAQAPMEGVRWMTVKLFGSRGFEAYPGLPYKQVHGDEFDMDGMGGNEESLSHFIDEAEYDDHAPNVYDSSPVERKPLRGDRERDLIAGGAQAATSEVPKLQAPPRNGGRPAPQNFSIADEDDLL